MPATSKPKLPRSGLPGAAGATAADWAAGAGVCGSGLQAASRTSAQAPANSSGEDVDMGRDPAVEREA